MASAVVSGIYMIRNTVNGRYYVGSTNNRVVRWQDHRYKLKSNRHYNKHLQSAWNKYGEHAFEFVWLCDIPVEQLLIVETAYLENNTDGYNTSKDAKAFSRGLKWPEERKRKLSEKCKGRKHSEETKKKIGDVQRGKPRGSPSAETRAKISASLMGHEGANKGVPMSEEHKETLRQANLGNKHWLGKKHTDETKAKIGNAHRGRKLSPETIAKRTASRAGWRPSEETRKKMSEAQKRRYQTLTESQELPM